MLECDPDYASKIKLGTLTVETFGDAYFAERSANEPFAWAALNLAEAKANQLARITVPWRYAILRMHEVFALIVPYFSADDLQRFHQHLKHVFADDYATVPHTSIERILALRLEGKLDIIKLGNDYSVETDVPGPGAVLIQGNRKITFPAFIEAIGQDTLSAPDLPFPSLRRRGAVKPATVIDDPDLSAGSPFGEKVETKGLALDAKFRPVITAPLCNNLFCLSLPFLLHQFPFVQGITSSSDLAGDSSGRNLSGHRSQA